MNDEIIAMFSSFIKEIENLKNNSEYPSSIIKRIRLLIDSNENLSKFKSYFCYGGIWNLSQLYPEHKRQAWEEYRKSLLEDLHIIIEDINGKYTFSKNSYNIQEKKEPIIFLSHSSKDKCYCDALRDFIIGLGVNKLIYTSHEQHKIPLGVNIYEYLRESFAKNILVIIFLSKDYLNSSACLCELGASWVMKCDYVSIFSSESIFKNPKYKGIPISKDIMGIKIYDKSCRTDMISLKDKIASIFNRQINEKDSSYHINNFIESIKSLQNVSK